MDTLQQRTTKNRTTTKVPSKHSNLVLYGIGAGALVGGGYLLYRYFQDRAASGGDTIVFNPRNPSSGSTPPNSPTTIPTIATPPIITQNSGQFPLKQGARGGMVQRLQNALLAIGGSAAALIRSTSMRGSTPDGIFGPGTAKALLAAGFSTTVTASVFSRLLAMTSGGAKNVFSSGNQTLAGAISKGANERNLFAVIAGLQKIKDPKQYIAVSSFFKNVRVLGIRVTSLVNALLSVAFRSNEPAKIKIRAEFRRMGLVQNSRGVWSIPALGAIDSPEEFKRYLKETQVYDLAVTDRATVLKTADGSYITPPLNPNTIVGYVASSHNGITKLLAPNGETVYAPSNNLRLL